MMKNIIPEKIKLKTGPAATVINRAHKGAPCIDARLKTTGLLDDFMSNS